MKEKNSIELENETFLKKVLIIVSLGLLALIIGFALIFGIPELINNNKLVKQLESRYSGFDIKVINIDKLAEDPNGIYYKYDIVVYYENTKTIRNVETNKVEYIEKSK